MIKLLFIFYGLYFQLTTIPLLLLSTTLFLFFPSVKFGITCSSSFLGSGSQFWIPLLIRHIQNLSLLFNFKIHLILQLQNQLSLVRFQNFFIQASYTIRIKLLNVGQTILSMAFKLLLKKQSQPTEVC
nr:uncharacterized protein LOC112790034 [Arachis hypogaea]